MTHHMQVASEKSIVPGLVVPADFEAPEGWSPAAVYESTRSAHEAGLAILAMGHAYWLLPHEESYIICVSTEKLSAVQRELAALQQLGGRAAQATSGVSYQELPVNAWSFVLYVVLLSALFAAQFFTEIQSAGRTDSVAMMNGEWWRAVTALTLHSDVVHLVSNLVAGIGFAVLLVRFFGAGASWFLILISGAAGNALNAWVHYPDAHYSIGASTAVFGALGLITGVGLWIALMQPAERWTMPRWLLPAFGGLTLLGLLGVGEGLDGRIDVAAHISGFICGGLLGLVCTARQAVFVRLDRYGRWLGLLAPMLIGVAWLAALLI